MSVNEIDYLTVDDLLEIPAVVLDNVTLTDAGALAAAVGRPPVTILGEDAYPTFDDKAAALLYSLVRNHSLVDGNQRLAWAAGGATSSCRAGSRPWPRRGTRPRSGPRSTSSRRRSVSSNGRSGARRTSWRSAGEALRGWE